MNTRNTDRALNILSVAEREKKVAESRFQENKRRIESRAKFTVISVDNMSTAIDILADVSNTMDELYASYETIVRMIDRECRPLLNEGLEASIIKKIAETIRDINQKTSQLSSTATGTVDGLALGDIRSEHYLVSIEARSIEKFWETKFSLHPEAAELRRKDKEESEREKKSRAAYRLRVEERENKERAERAELASQYDKAKQHCDEERKRVGDHIKAYNNSLRNVLDKIPQIIKEYVANLQKQISKELEQKKKLGFFDIAAKKEIKKKISNLKKEGKSKSSSKYENQTRSYFSNSMNLYVGEYSKMMEEHFRQQFPQYREEKKDPNATFTEKMGEAEIIHMLSKYGTLTVTEILEHSELFCHHKITNQLASRYIRSLVDKLIVERTVRDEKSYFSISQDLALKELKKQVEVYAENSAIAQRNFPSGTIDASQFEKMIQDYISK